MSHAADYDDMVGIYESIPLNSNKVQIEKRGSDYLMCITDRECSSPSDIVEPISKEDFERSSGTKVDDTFVGFKTGDMVMYKLPKGWHAGEHNPDTGFEYKTDTGYLLVSLWVHGAASEMKKLSDTEIKKYRLQHWEKELTALKNALVDHEKSLQKPDLSEKQRNNIQTDMMFTKERILDMETNKP